MDEPLLGPRIARLRVADAELMPTCGAPNHRPAPADERVVEQVVGLAALALDVHRWSPPRASGRRARAIPREGGIFGATPTLTRTLRCCRFDGGPGGGLPRFLSVGRDVRSLSLSLAGIARVVETALLARARHEAKAMTLLP